MKTLRFLGALALATLVSFLPVASFAAPTPAASTDSSAILGLYPGFQSGFFTDAYGAQFKSITDSTAVTPAAIGKIVYFNGSVWIQAATNNLASHPGMYGAVIVPATAQGGTALIQTQGLVTQLSVKTGGSFACAATGNAPMAITTTGDLTPTAAATVPGVTWGMCASVLAVSQGATLISGYIGGY